RSSCRRRTADAGLPLFNFGASADASAWGGRLMRSTAIRLLALGASALLPLLALSWKVQAAPKMRAPSLQAPSKDAPILLEADEVVYDSEANTVSAVGRVEISDEGRTLLAD